VVAIGAARNEGDQMGASVMKWCECSDPGCPAHKGQSGCQTFATMVLWREDMMDLTGTPMCTKCGTDALESGLFRTEED
jgi:Zn ribbon nucleic-acid-binding protein